jgi:hypothetical protein
MKRRPPGLLLDRQLTITLRRYAEESDMLTMRWPDNATRTALTMSRYCGGGHMTNNKSQLSATSSTIPSTRQGNSSDISMRLPVELVDDVRNHHVIKAVAVNVWHMGCVQVPELNACVAIAFFREVQHPTREVNPPSLDTVFAGRAQSIIVRCHIRCRGLCWRAECIQQSHAEQGRLRDPEAYGRLPHNGKDSCPQALRHLPFLFGRLTQFQSIFSGLMSAGARLATAAVKAFHVSASICALAALLRPAPDVQGTASIRTLSP